MARITQALGFLAAITLAATVWGQTTAPASQPPIDPLAEGTLQMLHDRRETLKDFQAKVVYDVYHPDTDDHEGKRGTVDVVIDPANGPQFSVHFTDDTIDGKPVKRHLQDLVFDGRKLTLIDRRAMRFNQQDVLPPGEKPGAADLLKSQVPLPIGIPPDEVRKNFEVSALPATDGTGVILTLVPRAEVRADFDFREVQLTVNKQMQLPVKIVKTDKKGVVTTVEFQDPAINTGKSTMMDTTPPKEPGWDVDIK
jgi:hypothetical protein